MDKVSLHGENTTMSDQLLTVDEIQQRLRVCRTKAYLIVANEMLAIRLGRSVRVRESEFDAFLARKTQEPALQEITTA